MHSSRNSAGAGLLAAALASACLLLSGCGDGRPPMAAPVTGRVLLDGEPLEFGGIMFQPAGGHPARGQIGPDGQFSLSTYEQGDGAAIGKHTIRVTCYQGQRDLDKTDINSEPALGKSLIPERYTIYETSGLEAEVKAQNEPFEFNLSSKED